MTEEAKNTENDAKSSENKENTNVMDHNEMYDLNSNENSQINYDRGDSTEIKIVTGLENSVDDTLGNNWVDDSVNKTVKTEQDDEKPLAIGWKKEEKEDNNDNVFSSTPKTEPAPYLGLVNNSMTCYLNAVIQTLFMTPEFRDCMYKWKESEEVNKEKSIPYNLQKLFLELQFSPKEKIKAVETINLTKSFGWKSSDRDMQNDVQELIRKLFEALEPKLANTDMKDIITELYQGKTNDCIKCKTCSYVSPKDDSFLDLNLAVKSFGAEKAFHSLEESLKDYLKVETIDGVNCSQCNEKREIEKYIEIKEFPYLLTIQLKRFDFDYMSMQRIKLSDRVEFKNFMDLSDFIAEDPMNISPDGPAVKPTEYELYSVIIHSGSANTGHYYAYIKSFDNQKWYSFNDENIEEISEERLKGVFGDDKQYYASSYSSSTNAYIFLYRRIDESKNKKFEYDLEKLPSHIQEMVKEIKEYNKDSGNSGSRHVSWMHSSATNTLSELPGPFTGGGTPYQNEKKRIDIYMPMSIADPSKPALSLADSNWDNLVSRYIYVRKSDENYLDVAEKCFNKFKLYFWGCQFLKTNHF